MIGSGLVDCNGLPCLCLLIDVALDSDLVGVIVIGSGLLGGGVISKSLLD